MPYDNLDLKRQRGPGLENYPHRKNNTQTHIGEITTALASKPKTKLQAAQLVAAARTPTKVPNKTIANSEEEAKSFQKPGKPASATAYKQW